jgi:hypothetical protein
VCLFMFVVVANVVVFNETTTPATLVLFFDICSHVKSYNLFLANGCVVGCKQDKINNLIILSKLEQVDLK